MTVFGIWDHVLRKILAFTAFFNLNFLIPIYICYKQNDVMDLYLCFTRFSIYQHGRQQVQYEQPVQNTPKENNQSWLKACL